ncbi:MAG: hypothetical protein GXO10_03050 [Crenarchaeota archaeon]|nr:hypothetical protein [Thermoproteota archaeon]
MTKVVVFLRSGNKIVLSTDATKEDVVKHCMELSSKPYLQIINVGDDTVVLKVEEIEAIHIMGERPIVPDEV